MTLLLKREVDLRGAAGVLWTMMLGQNCADDQVSFIHDKWPLVRPRVSPGTSCCWLLWPQPRPSSWHSWLKLILLPRPWFPQQLWGDRPADPIANEGMQFGIPSCLLLAPSDQRNKCEPLAARYFRSVLRLLPTKRILRLGEVRRSCVRLQWGPVWRPEPTATKECSAECSTVSWIASVHSTLVNRQLGTPESHDESRFSTKHRSRG